MPVLPVLFKHFAKTESYRRSVSVFRYIRFGSKESCQQLEEGAGKEGSDAEGRYKIRLAFPKATMTGLGTLIRGVNGSEDKEKSGVSIREESFAQLDSVDEDYHMQLRASK
jgi:hypothetical protein